jgi:hypothetical protein
LGGIYSDAAEEEGFPAPESIVVGTMNRLAFVEEKKGCIPGDKCINIAASIKQL